MAVNKKGDAEATANLTKNEYITIRNTMQENTHVARLFDYLWLYGSITSMECFERLGNTRIGATIYTLRHDYNVPVRTVMKARKVMGKAVPYGVYSIRKG